MEERNPNTQPLFVNKIDAEKEMARVESELHEMIDRFQSELDELLGRILENG